MTFLLTGQGRPFTVAGFGNWFRDRCNEAGLSQCPPTDCGRRVLSSLLRMARLPISS